MTSRVGSQRPAWLESLHAIADPRWIRLDADEILDEARRNTGFDDFGGTTFLEPYRLFVEACDQEANLHAVGRLLTRSDLLNWLENRLRLADARKSTPEIVTQEIDAPLFITGLPRTGTSILHELLASDPGARAPRHWEVRYPCPAPEAATYDTDARRELSGRELRLWNEVVPEYDTMHELGGHIPVQCIQITAHEFVSDELLGRAQVPSYGAWYAGADLEPAYRFHRQFLQHLQHRAPGRWVLKAPSHLGCLDALFAVYPDARIVWTHRDPLQVIPSVASILYATARVRSDAVDPEAVKAWFTPETCLAQIERALAFRDSGRVSEAQFCDVPYAELVRNPIASIQSIYDRFEIPFGRETEESMTHYIASKPKDKHGRHHYALDAGRDPSFKNHRESFRAYQDRFAVPTESD